MARATLQSSLHWAVVVHHALLLLVCAPHWKKKGSLSSLSAAWCHASISPRAGYNAQPMTSIHFVSLQLCSATCTRCPAWQLRATLTLPAQCWCIMVAQAVAAVRQEDACLSAHHTYTVKSTSPKCKTPASMHCTCSSMLVACICKHLLRHQLVLSVHSKPIRQCPDVLW